MGNVHQVSRVATDAPIWIEVTRDGSPITGLTVLARIVNGDDASQFLDFNDNAFKDAGHTTPTLAVPEASAANLPGLYAVDGGHDLSAINAGAGPAAASLFVHYTISGTDTGIGVDVLQVIEGQAPWLTATGFAVAGDAMALTPAERTTLAGVVDTTLGTSHGVGSWVTATGFAIAGDAMTLTAGERTAIDAALVAAHGAGSWVGVGLTAGQAAELSYLHIHAGAVNGNKMNHTTAVIGTPGRAYSDDLTVDQTVTQVDANTATFEQVP